MCDSSRQGKAKLCVNVDTDVFNCWVCGFRGGNLGPLMKYGSEEQREYLAERNTHRQAEETLERCHSLPEQYIPLDLRAPATSGPYRRYLHARGVTDEAMGLYRVGYADMGPYAGRVIVPSFDALGSINFFSARSIHPDVKPAYYLPEASKDIISNEHMVDWTKPVYLVEGIFDEMGVGPQAIALYGKFLPMSLIMKMMQSFTPAIYICLDDDARSEAIGMLKQLVGYGFTAAVVDLPGKDPADLGRKAVVDQAMNSRLVTGSMGIVATEGCF